MSGISAVDTLGNEIVFLSNEGVVSLVHSGPTSNYSIDTVERITLNHLTHVLFDGVREWKYADEWDRDALYEALRILLPPDALEEYNRDLAIAETADGELILISDAGLLLGEEVFSQSAGAGIPGSGEGSSIVCAGVRVVGYAIHSGTETGVAMYAEPGPSEEKIEGMTQYSLGVLPSSSAAPMEAELALQNSGRTAWPEDTCLRCVAGDGCGVQEIPLAAVASGEIVALTMGLTLANPGASYWAFCSGRSVLPDAPLLTIEVV